MFGLGLWEWLMILFLATLVFGPKFIVKSFQNLWNSLTGFGKAFKDASAGAEELPARRAPKALPSARDFDGDGED